MALDDTAAVSDIWLWVTRQRWGHGGQWDTAANVDMAAIAAVGDMAIVTYETHAFHPGQNICTLRCEWRGKARRHHYLPR